MPELIRKWGRIGILSTIFGTVIATAIIWLFTTATEVRPLLKSVERIESSLHRIEQGNADGHKKLIRLIEIDQENMYAHSKKLYEQEILTNLNTETLRNCKEEHK